MTRGQAQRAMDVRVYRMPDGFTVTNEQIVEEAARELRKRAMQDAIDKKRRQWDAEVEAMCLKFGFDSTGEAIA